MTDPNKPASHDQRAKPDTGQEQTLLRDLAIINARVLREQGVMPIKDVTAAPKRKPNLPARDARLLPEDPADAAASIDS